MFCKNCGNEIAEGDICTKCGTMNAPAQMNNCSNPQNNNQYENNTPYSPYNQGYNNQGYNQNSNLMNAFIGNSKAQHYSNVFTKIETGSKYSWNWCAFLFGGMWFVYRKMYLYALGIFVGSAVLGGILGGIGLSDSGANSLNLLVALLMGLFGNYAYYTHANKKVNEISSMNIDDNQKYLMASQKGGTNILAPILLIVGLFVLIFIFVLLVGSLATGMSSF